MFHFNSNSNFRKQLSILSYMIHTNDQAAVSYIFVRPNHEGGVVGPLVRLVGLAGRYW